MKKIGHRTIKGRIVYPPDHTPFKWRDVFRISNRVRKRYVAGPWTVKDLADLAYLYSLVDMCMSIVQSIPEYPLLYGEYWSDIKKYWSSRSRSRSEESAPWSPDDHQFTFRAALDVGSVNPLTIGAWWLQKKILAFLPVLDIINDVKTLSEQ